MCHVKSIYCGCVPAILAKWPIYRVEEHVDEMVFEYNLSCQISLVWMCTWNILKPGDFMLLQGGGISKSVILQSGGTCRYFSV